MNLSNTDSINNIINGSRAGAVVRVLASRRCGPGSILSTDHMWAKFFLGISPLREVFPRGLRFSPLLKNQHF